MQGGYVPCVILSMENFSAVCSLLTLLYLPLWGSLFFPPCSLSGELNKARKGFGPFAQAVKKPGRAREGQSPLALKSFPARRLKTKGFSSRPRPTDLTIWEIGKSPRASETGADFCVGKSHFPEQNRFLAVSAPESVDIISDAQIALYMYLYLYFLGCFVHIIHCHKRIPPLLFISLLANGVKIGVNCKASTSFESGSALVVSPLVPINEMLFPNSPICLRSTSSSMCV